VIAAMAQPYCAKKRRQRRCMSEAQRLERKKYIKKDKGAKGALIFLYRK
jgi:hypothetical protein